VWINGERRDLRDYGVVRGGSHGVVTCSRTCVNKPQKTHKITTIEKKRKEKNTSSVTMITLEKEAPSGVLVGREASHRAVLQLQARRRLEIGRRLHVLAHSL
jgi:hypothetical protein